MINIITAVVYDVDNVLVSSKEANFAKYNDFSIALGLGPLRKDALDGLSGTTGEQILQSLFPGKEEEVKKIYSQISPHIELMVPETGVKEALNELQKRGIKLAVATNRREVSLRPLLAHHGFDGYFSPDSVVCKEGDEFLTQGKIYKNTFKSGKPDPECVNLALSILGIGPKEAIYIGDAPEDEEASRKAGVNFVGFKPSFPCRRRIEDHRRIVDYL